MIGSIILDLLSVVITFVGIILFGMIGCFVLYFINLVLHVLLVDILHVDEVLKEIKELWVNRHE